MDSISIYLKELKNRNSTQKQTVELITEARQGDEKSKRKVIENYLLYVVKIAREYMNKGVPYEDLISEGNLGLLKAIDKYDINNGSTFGSYSKFWIKQSIIRNCMHNKRIVRLPENISELLRTDRWKGSQEYKEFSLDISQEDGYSLVDKLHDEENIKFITKEEEKILCNKVQRILSFLNKRESEIIHLYYGIGTEAPMGIQEIAVKFNLTTAMVNKIIRDSMKKLRDSQKTNYNRDSFKIISAFYGSEKIRIDVTNKITSMLKNNESIKSCNKLSGDPCKGIPKFLFINFSVGENTFTKRISEGSYVKF